MPTKSPQRGPAPKASYLRPAARQELESDIAICDDQIQADDPKVRVTDRNAVVHRRRRLVRQIQERRRVLRTCRTTTASIGR